MIPIVVVRHRLCVDLWMCPLFLLTILVLLQSSQISKSKQKLLPLLTQLKQETRPSKPWLLLLMAGPVTELYSRVQ